MASSNAPSGSKAPHLPDLGLATQSAAPLRKPHSATTSKSSLDTVISATQSLTISSDSSNTQASTLQSKSILSPNAKEFVPKSYQQPVVQQQHQHHLQQLQDENEGWEAMADEEGAWQEMEQTLQEHRRAEREKRLREHQLQREAKLARKTVLQQQQQQKQY